MAYTDAEREHAVALEQHIRTSVDDFGTLFAPVATSRDLRSLIAQIHRIACLLYVNRAVHHLSGSEVHHKQLVKDGILLLKELETCQSAWPLFVIGCEATDEEQRAEFLAVCERSRWDARKRSNHVESTQWLVMAVWKQRDLDDEEQGDYMTILDAVIGASPIMPLFA